MSKTVQQLESAFPSEIIRCLVEALTEAYEVTDERYAPHYGHDAMTFGLMLYKSKVYFLKNLAEQYKWIRIINHGACFRFEINGYTLATHRIGDSVNEDVAGLFPGNKTAAPKLAANNKKQLVLPFPDVVIQGEADEYDDSGCRNLILADIGNPDDGFCMLYLNVPIDVSPDGRVGKWGTTHLIWSSDEMLGGVRSLNDIDRAPEETVVPPTITLREEVEDQEETIARPAMELREDNEAEDKKRNESK
jgi:hypothetical protein